VMFAIQNLSNSTFNNVPIQLVVTSSDGGEPETVTLVIPSWPPDSYYIGGFDTANFSWTPEPGHYTLTGIIDPNNQFSPASPLKHSAPFHVFQPGQAPGQMVVIPTQAGPDPPLPSSVIVSSGVQNNTYSGTKKDAGCTGGAGTADVLGGIEINLTAPYNSVGALPPDFPGCSINATLYKGVTLRNGWTVASISLSTANGQYAGNMNLGYTSPSTYQISGSTSLEMQFQSFINLQSPYPTDTLVKVTIQGPCAASPFDMSRSGRPQSATTKKAASSSSLKALGFEHKVK